MKAKFFVYFLLHVSFAYCELNPMLLNHVRSCSLAITSTDSLSSEDSYSLQTLKESKASYGSAFFYQLKKANDQIILTNFHVIKNALQEGENIIGCNAFSCDELVVKMIDKESDIAMLKSRSAKFNCNSGYFKVDLDPTDAAEVFIYGNKFGLGNSFAFGNLAAKNVKLPNGDVFHLVDINAGEGNSGGFVALKNSSKIIGMLKSIYSPVDNSFSALVIPSHIIESSIIKMNEILDFEEQLEFSITENDDQIYFIRKNDNKFFEEINLTPSDRIHSIDNNFVTNKIEILYDIYSFLKDEKRREMKIIFIRNGKLKNTVLTKNRGDAKTTVQS